ncbi:hypothetical protein AAG906_007533 [Vitis piasezkii]
MRFNFPQLRKFGIAGNQFTGIIPDKLSKISGVLELLDLGNNYLTGQVPDSLGVLKDLYWLSLEFDKLGRGTSGDLNLLYSLPNVSSLQANNFGPCYPSLVSQNSPVQFTPTFGNETDKLALLAFKNYVVNVPNGVLSSWNDSALLPVGGGYMQSPTSEGHSLEVGESEISWFLASY